MTREAEVEGWLRWRTRHAVAPGTPCGACGTTVHGAYCSACGQLAENFHRSVWHLLVEAFESFFHFDGRLVHTVPRLLVRPGTLTREYLEGSRAFQIPPLRMFLIVLLVFFFAGSFGAEARRAEMARVLQHSGAPTVFVTDTPAAAHPGIRTADWPKSLRGTFLVEGLQKAAQDPTQFRNLVRENVHQYAVLMLPIAALILSLLFVFQRRFYVFDHVIFSMHSLSFQGLLLSVVLLVSNVWTLGAQALLVVAPVHLFLHMRGTYGSSVIGTLVRMALLFLLSIVGFSLLMLGLAAFSLWSMTGP